MQTPNLMTKNVHLHMFLKLWQICVFSCLCGALQQQGNVSQQTKLGAKLQTQLDAAFMQAQLQVCGHIRLQGCRLQNGHTADCSAGSNAVMHTCYSYTASLCLPFETVYCT